MAEVEPDTYVLAKDGPRLLQVRIGCKSHQVVRAPTGVTRVDLSVGEAMDRVLSDAEALELARLALRVEAHYGGEPRDMEWAIAAGEIFLLSLDRSRR